MEPAGSAFREEAPGASAAVTATALKLRERSDADGFLRCHYSLLTAPLAIAFVSTTEGNAPT
jgi:hypothetical protein